MSGDRTPPNNERSEMLALGSAMHTRQAFDEVAAALRPEDFYTPRHEELWGVMLRMSQAGKPVDVETVAAELDRTKDLGRFQNGAYLHELISIVPTAANVGFHVAIVRDCALNRRLIARGTNIVQLGYNGADAASNITAAQNEILTLETPDAGTGRWIGEIIEDVMEAAESGVEAVPTMPWGYGPEMPPMVCGRMTVLAGRPGLGKSTAGLDAARHVGIHLGLPVAFFSLEMSQAEVGARTAAAEARIPLPNVQKGQMRAEDWERWARRVGLVLDAPLWVDDFPRSDPGYIRSVCRRLAREKGPLGLVVVDYLQLMEDDGAPASKSRQQTVSEFSRALTILAKEMESAPVLALAQLNRGPEMRADKRPQISDLRESGAIEQDASQVILIHREDAYEKETPRAGEVDLIIAKNRGGPTDIVTLAAQLHYSRFVPMVTEKEAPAENDRTWRPSDVLDRAS